ncbi:hypothetical protein [Streptomyces sp. 135]|uniref:hypothetical protein n=1 Tax=Streptomyces sp. 135 TaxID=2838850 RepID=UPI001CC078D1|nr:hypothetical protein [Streptomyces sp. 135]
MLDLTSPGARSRPDTAWARVAAAAAAHLHRLLQLRATALRGPTRPSYRVGCKRILLASDYYPALRQPNVDVVAQGVEKIGPRTITTADGNRRPADVIVFATGFRVFDPPVSHRVTGTDGRTLAEHWGEGMAAHNNVTVPGLPNLFLLLGPNSGLGHSSLVLMLEAQLDHVLACLGHLERTGAQAIEATREAWHTYRRQLRDHTSGSTWATGCDSWYLNPRTGHNTALWPRSVIAYRNLLRTFRPQDHTLTRRPVP